MFDLRSSETPHLFCSESQPSQSLSHCSKSLEVHSLEGIKQRIFGLWDTRCWLRWSKIWYTWWESLQTDLRLSLATHSLFNSLDQLLSCRETGDGKSLCREGDWPSGKHRDSSSRSPFKDSVTIQMGGVLSTLSGIWLSAACLLAQCHAFLGQPASSD